MVSDQEIAKAVESLLRQTELQNSVTSINDVVHQLGEKLGLNLTHKTDFIRDQINLVLRSHPHQQHHHHHPPPPPLQHHQFQPQPQAHPQKDHFALHSQPQQQQHYPQQFPPHFALHPYHPHSAAAPPPPHLQQQPFPPPPQHQVHVHLPPPQPQQLVAKNEAFSPNASSTVTSPKPAKENAPATGTKRRGGPGGLNKVCGVSPELQAIVGEPALPRTEIVRQLWAYIRKNNLQDPSNKRKIICDDALRIVFETDCTDMFKMNKLLAKHIIALEPSKASTQSKRAKVAAAAAAAAAEAEPAPENNDDSSLSVVISEALAKFFGTAGREMVKAEALRRVWEYVKVNNLEDPVNSMVILCDEKLRELLGVESISALGISEMVTHKHLFQRA